MGEIRKIAFFSGIFHPESGGPATYLYKLCSSLVTDGYAVTMLAYGEVGKYKYPYPVKKISRRFPLPLRLALYFFNALKYGARADLLFVSDIAGLPVTFANFFLRKKTVIKIVGDFAWEKAVRDGLTKDNIDDFQNKRQKRLVGFYKLLQRFYVSRADLVITPSKYLKKIITGWGIEPKKIKVIYNAIEEGLTPGPSPSLERGRRNSSKKILLTVARLVPWKGIDKIIKVLPELLKKYKNLEYWVIGDGPELANLQKLAVASGVAKQVKFLGKKSNQDVLKYMSRSDLFILYSSYEGLPHVVLEALSVGLPSLVSACGGNPEAIAIGRCGAVCESDRELVPCISKLLAVPPKLKGIPDIFKWDHLVEEVEEVINAI